LGWQLENRCGKGDTHGHPKLMESDDYPDQDAIDKLTQLVQQMEDTISGFSFEGDGVTGTMESGFAMGQVIEESG
jgi:hypothetical protein